MTFYLYIVKKIKEFVITINKTIRISKISVIMKAQNNENHLLADSLQLKEIWFQGIGMIRF